MRIITFFVLFAASVSVVFAQTPQGSIVGWGSQAVGVDLSGESCATPDWLPGEGLPGTDQTAYASTVWDPDGAGPQQSLLVVGGSFSIAGQAVANHIAAWEGNQWQPLGTGMNIYYEAAVYALSAYDGELIAGGGFTTAGGMSANRIAKWNGASWSPLGSGMSNGSVRALTVFDDGTGSALYAGGYFSTAGGGSANDIAKWNGATWSALGSGMGGNVSSVSALTVYNGELIASGDFTTAGGVSANRVARWNGTTWQPLGSGMNRTVRALKVYNGELIAGGDFTNRVVRWNGTTWQPLGVGMNGYYVFTLTVYDGEVIAGGDFTTAGGVPGYRVARWNGTTWQSLGAGMNSYLDAYVYTLAVYNGDLIAGGRFTTAGGVTVNNIARWDGETWYPLGSGLDGAVSALTVYNGELIAGGYFWTAGDVSAKRIARWNGTSWSPLGSDIDNPWQVNALTVYNGDLIAGGRFTTAGGVTVNHIARWDGVTWHPFVSGMSGTPGCFGGCSSEVYALTVLPNGDLVAGGFFDNAGGVSANRIARWDGEAWHPFGTGLGYGSVEVLALAVHNGELFAAGSFLVASDASANHIARWDGENWHPLGSGLDDWPQEVNALAVYSGELIAGGSFTVAGGVEANRLAKWDGISWSPLGSGMNSSVVALTVYNGELIAGGYFTTAGRNVSVYWARWGCVPTQVLSVAPQQRGASQSASITTFSVANAGSGTMNWTAAVMPGSPWLRITSGSSGVNSGTIYVGFDANPNPASRTGVIRVSAPGAVPAFVDVQVVQVGNAAKPNVISQIPAPGATEVPLDQLIEARFDADLRASSVNARSALLSVEWRNLGFPVAYNRPANVAYDAARRAVLVTPTETLRSGARYRVVLSSLISGADGTAIDPVSWEFTTAGWANARDGVIGHINDFASSARDALSVQRDTAANNIFRGLQTIWEDWKDGLVRTAFGILVGALDDTPLFDSGARVSNGFRILFSKYYQFVKPLEDLGTAGWIVSGFKDRAEMVKDLGFDGSSYWFAPPELIDCVDSLDDRLRVDDQSGRPPAPIIGIEAIIQEVNSIRDRAIERVPKFVSEEDADKAIQWLEEKRKDLLDSIVTEVHKYTASGYVGDALPLEPLLLVMGQTNTATRQIDQAIDRIREVSQAKWMVFVGSAGLTALKIAGVATLAGATVVAFVDLAPLVFSLAQDTIENFGEDSNAIVTPKEALVHGIFLSAELLAQDAAQELLFARDTLDEALLIASGHYAAVAAAFGGRGGLADCVVTVVESDVADIDLDVALYGQAELSLYNDCPAPAAVRLVATIYMPGADGVSAILGFAGPRGQVALGPLEKKPVTFVYSAPRSAGVLKEGYLMRIEGTAVVDGLTDRLTLPQVEKRFHVGSPAELALLSPYGEQVAVSGSVGPGEDASHWFDFPAGLQTVEFRLVHDLSTAIDLHLYDPYGNHTGQDYEADYVELAVPGITYTGIGSDPQVIRVVAPPAGVYRLRVVGHGTTGTYTVMTVGLPPLPAMLAFVPQTLTVGGWPGTSVAVEVGLMEWAGTEGVDKIQFTVGDLQGEGGVIIAADRLELSPSAESVAAGGSESVAVAIRLPLDAAPGVYHGLIEAAGTTAAAELQLSLVVRRFGDVDGNESIDLVDVRALQLCFGRSRSDGDCAAFGFGFDVTGMVGLDNYAAFRQVITGP